MKQISLLVACGVLLALSSCTLMRKGQKTNAGNNAAPTEQTAAENKDGQENGTAEGAVEPTQAQQEAAQKLLLEGGAQPGATTAGAADTATPPGRGIRMGGLAPREEAASSSDASEPAPNSADRRGLRSLPLPQGLPMDPDGKLNSN